MSNQLRIRERIAPTGQTMTWRQGFERMKPKGGMPHHVLLDRHLCDENYRATLTAAQREEIDRAFPLLSLDLGVHPAKGEKFRRGADIYDTSTGLYLPWSELVRHVQPSELMRRKTLLLVTPKDVIDAQLRGAQISVVHTENITTVHPAVEVSGTCGEADERTGLVLEVSSRRLAKLPEMKRRRLYRDDKESCGLLGRGGGFVIIYVRHYVFLFVRPSDRFGVAGVVYDVLDESGKVIATTDVKPASQGQPLVQVGVQQQG